MKYLLGVDIETTGIDPDKCEITQLAAILLDSHLREIGSFSSYLSISRRALRAGKKNLIRDKETGLKVDVFEFTGIDGDKLRKSAPNPKKVLQQFIDWLYNNIEPRCTPFHSSEIVLFGQNISFDELRLQKLFKKYKFPWLFDYHTIDLASIYFGQYLKQFKQFPPSIGQNRITKALGVSTVGRTHNALDDIRTSTKVLRKLVDV